MQIDIIVRAWKIAQKKELLRIKAEYRIMITLGFRMPVIFHFSFHATNIFIIIRKIFQYCLHGN